MNKLVFLFLCILFLSNKIYSQTQDEFINIFDSYNDDNYCKFIKELEKSNYLFEYNQFPFSRLFIVNNEGEVHTWESLDLEGYDRVAVMGYFETKKGLFLICFGITKDNSFKLLSLKLNDELDMFTIIDSYDLSREPLRFSINYVVNRDKNKFIFTSTNPNNIFDVSRYLVVTFSKDGKYISVDELRNLPNNGWQVEDVLIVPNSNKRLISILGLYESDLKFDSLKKIELFLTGSPNFSDITFPRLKYSNTDSTIIIAGKVINPNNNIGLMKFKIQNDSLVEHNAKLKYQQQVEREIYNITNLSIEQNGQFYIGFLDGLVESTNSINLLKFSSDLEKIWIFKYEKNDAKFFFSEIKLLSDGHIMIWGRVTNYYGKNITNGFYLKVSAQGQIITKTTFPLPTQTEISVFPNPVKDYIILSSDYKKKVNFTLYNSIGQKVFSKETMMDNTRIDLPNNLVKGAYLYQILDREGGLLNSGKLVLER